MENSQQEKQEGAEDIFNTHWPNIEAIVKKLVLNHAISKQDWQNSSWDMYKICTWQTNGSHKLLKALMTELVDTYFVDVNSKLISIADPQLLLIEFLKCFDNFELLSERLVQAFQQLDSATKSATILVTTTVDGVITHVPIPSKLPPMSSYRPKVSERSTIRSYMVTLWVERVLQFNITRLIDSVLDLVRGYRENPELDDKPICVFFHSCKYVQLHSGQVYKHFSKLFEDKYFEDLELYFATRAGEKLETIGVIEYMKWALDISDKEMKKINAYLGEVEEYYQRTESAIYKALLEKFVEQVLNHAENYVQSNDPSSIKLMSTFLERLGYDSINGLLRTLDHSIIKIGMYQLEKLESINPGNYSERFVEKLLELHGMFDEFLKKAFDNDERALSMLEKNFKILINGTQTFKTEQSVSELDSLVGPGANQMRNLTETKCSESLATYCHLLLRKTSRKITQKDLIVKLKRILNIVKLLSDKEMFMKYYKSFFGRRLIFNASVSMEIEELVLDDMKPLANIPSEHTYKLVRMLKDLKSSEDIQNNFRKRYLLIFYKTPTKVSCEEAKNNNNNNNTIHSLTSQINNKLVIQYNNNKMPVQGLLSTEFKVLNPSAWMKTSDKYPINLPEELTSIMINFQNFYTDEYPGRKLDWCHRLSHGTVDFNSDKGQFELEVTAAQLTVLTVFNKKPESQKTELEKSSGLNSNEFKRTLWSLVANPKLKSQPIIAQPEVIDIKDLDNDELLLKVNKDFVLMKNGKPQTEGRVSLIGRLQI